MLDYFSKTWKMNALTGFEFCTLVVPVKSDLLDQQSVDIIHIVCSSAVF